MYYKIVLTDLPKKFSSKALRAIRLTGKLSLKDTMEIASYAKGMSSITLASGLAEGVASRMLRPLAEAGLQAEIVQSVEASTPMILAPKVRSCYRWSFGFIVKC